MALQSYAQLHNIKITGYRGMYISSSTHMGTFLVQLDVLLPIEEREKLSRALEQLAEQQRACTHLLGSKAAYKSEAGAEKVSAARSRLLNGAITLNTLDFSTLYDGCRMTVLNSVGIGMNKYETNAKINLALTL